MNSIKLTPNWPLQFTKCAAVLVLLFVIKSVFAITLKAAFLLLLPLIGVIIIFNFIHLRFLHCYQAGINYTRFMREQYINSEEIKSISFKSLFICTIFKVELENGKNYHFYNWRLSADEKANIVRLYKNKVDCKVDYISSCRA
ncbi:hypothetical protein AN395_03248 [Pseudoalteromonas sp. P1-30]|jgi:hypothetical protein|nr:hypothetical protein AN395_03248 [Pseudoalteromonas sp. P1-30]TMP83221.1 hypothetical protein CWB71_07705 [Pseudoalteromonas sp. S983]|tara:strand:- start:1083 stop:1511 length:429 start_codon:yes stop_codon:yes gene_type:complete